MQTSQPIYLSEPSLLDGYYVLSEGSDFVAFEQERACRFHEARFPTLSAAEHYVRELRLKRMVPSGAKA
jgi:hypothetical protein